MKPTRVQLRRQKGWRMPANTVRVTRPGPWGNPFRVEREGKYYIVAWTDASGRRLSSVPWDTERQAITHAVDKYREWLYSQKQGQHVASDARAKLRGLNLACWCGPDKPCHADALLEVANA